MASLPWLECLLAISEAIDQGLHVVDANGITVLFNQKAARLDGVSVEDVLGRHILDVYPSLTPETSRLLSVIRTGVPIASSQQTYVNYKGQAVTCINSTYPLVVDGKIVGAFELMTDVTSLAETTDRLVTLVQSQVQDRAGKESRTHLYGFEDIITGCPAMLRAIELARRAAPLSSPVFVYGETGTGKELIVQAIHRSRGRKGLLVEQNCAALPETLLETTLFGVVSGSFTGARDRPGLLELAHDGTLYLDEVNSMPQDLQAKLLRALQENYVRRVGDTRQRPTSFRVLASCNVDPLSAIRSGSLRSDLFYRLSAVLIELPPLRERGDDLRILVRYFLDRMNKNSQSKIKDLSPEVWKVFETYSWPGNIRELQHVLEHARVATTGDTITLEAIPGYLLRSRDSETATLHCGALDSVPARTPRKGTTLRTELDRVERDLILSTLQKTGGNISRAAQDLGIPRQTLQSKLVRLGIRRPGK